VKFGLTSAQSAALDWPVLTVYALGGLLYRQVSRLAYNPFPRKIEDLPLQTLKSGSIIFAVAAGIDCVIRNPSETGAALEVESPVGVIGAFTLLIKPEILKRKCQIL